MPVERLLILRPPTPADELWAVAECLRCKAVAATVAAPGAPLSRVEARRLGLAVEAGGGVGILLRSLGKTSANHAAVTRWHVRPARGERAVQRWEAQLLHSHGGRIGQTVLLEVCRETNHLRAAAPLADRTTPPGGRDGWATPRRARPQARRVSELPPRPRPPSSEFKLQLVLLPFPLVAQASSPVAHLAHAHASVGMAPGATVVGQGPPSVGGVVDPASPPVGSALRTIGRAGEGMKTVRIADPTTLTPTLSQREREKEPSP